MKIIISPAKKMNVNTDFMEIRQTPVFSGETARLLQQLRAMNYEELKLLWKCNDKLARLNYERILAMNPDSGLTPALLSYEGLQYQHIAPAVLEQSHWDYMDEHLRILSGFYGLVRPLDGVTPYRLEMQAVLAVGSAKNLYEFWGQKLYDQLTAETDTIINLASKEYSRCIEPYITSAQRFITCIFGEETIGNKIVEKGTYAKMARGEMVRFMAEQAIKKPEQMKTFNRLGFLYDASVSDDNTYVFVRR